MPSCCKASRFARATPWSARDLKEANGHSSSKMAARARISIF
jgi:hypothetical protein